MVETVLMREKKVLVFLKVKPKSADKHIILLIVRELTYIIYRDGCFHIVSKGRCKVQLCTVQTVVLMVLFTDCVRNIAKCFKKIIPCREAGDISGPSYSLIRTKPKPYRCKFVNLL